MPELDIVTLDAPTLDPTTNLPTIRATVPLSAEQGTTDVEEFGKVDSAQCLGITSLPYPADDAGHAEGVIARNVGNTDGVILGGRDSRCAAVVGKLKAGDTALHSTDPAASAQVQCKATRQAVMMTKDGDGNNMLLTLDGKNDKIQIAAFGAIVQITKDQIMLCEPSGKASIVMKDGCIALIGKVILGGLTATARLASCPGSTMVLPLGAPASPSIFVPAPNVYVGTGNPADVVP